MREAISGTWLFVVVIAFVVLFTGYLCLAINYSKAFNVKNEIIDIIERENGMTEEASEQIETYLKNIGYRTKGTCPSGFTGNTLERDVVTKEYYYCYRTINTNLDSEGEAFETDQADSVYYQIVVFFRIDLPIFQDAFKFDVRGDSVQIFYPENT